MELVAFFAHEHGTQERAVLGREPAVRRKVGAEVAVAPGADVEFKPGVG